MTTNMFKLVSHSSFETIYDLVRYVVYESTDSTQLQFDLPAFVEAKCEASVAENWLQTRHFERERLLRDVPKGIHNSWVITDMLTSFDKATFAGLRTWMLSDAIKGSAIYVFDILTFIRNLNELALSLSINGVRDVLPICTHLPNISERLSNDLEILRQRVQSPMYENVFTHLTFALNAIYFVEVAELVFPQGFFKLTTAPYNRF